LDLEVSILCNFEYWYAQNIYGRRRMSMDPPLHIYNVWLTLNKIPLELPYYLDERRKTKKTERKDKRETNNE
jgi:hypothetical protein